MTDLSPQKSLPQWSLKHIMVAMAILSGFLAVGAYMGFNNGFFILCAIASGILTSFFSALIPRRKFGCATTVVCVVLVLLCNPLLMFFSIVMAVNCLCHFGLVVFAKRRNPPPSAYRTLLYSSAISLFAFCVGVGVGLPGYLKFREELQTFEPVDLTARLEYEANFESEGSSDNDWEDQQNLRDQEHTFSMLEERNERMFGRHWALEGLHFGRAEEFVKSPGFGVSRMFPPTIDRARSPELVDIDFLDNRELEYWVPFQRYDDISRPARAERMHKTTMFDFVHPEGFGLNVAPKVFKGFLPHAFHQSPLELSPQFDFAPTVDTAEPTNRLKLRSLQLISLRRFDSPRAYVLDHLPRMDQLSDDQVETRKLNVFELEALEKLETRTEELLLKNGTEVSDIVLNYDTNQVEMVGALRAINACLDCHNAKKHEMLGAFTYRFTFVEKEE